MSTGYVSGLLQGFTLATVLSFIGYGIELFYRRRLALREAQRPRPVNDQAPPQYAVYEQIPGEPPELCSCHQRPLESGESIFVWPGPADIFCEQGFKGETT